MFSVGSIFSGRKSAVAPSVGMPRLSVALLKVAIVPVLRPQLDLELGRTGMGRGASINTELPLLRSLAPFSVPVL